MRPVVPDLQRRIDSAGTTARPINNNSKLAIGIGVGFGLLLVLCVIGALWWFRGIRRNTEALHSTRKSQSHNVSGSSGNSRRKQSEQRTHNSEATLYGPGPPTAISSRSREPPPPLPSPLPTAVTTTRTSHAPTSAAVSPIKDVHPRQSIPLESISQMRPLAPPTFARPPSFEQTAVSPMPILEDSSHNTGMTGSPHMNRLEPREGRRSSEDMNDLITMLDSGPPGSRTRPPSYRSHESKAKSIRPLSGESSLSAIPYTIPVPMPPIPYEVYDQKRPTAIDERFEEEYEMAGSDTTSLRSRSATGRGGAPTTSIYSFGESSYVTSPGASSSTGGSTRRGPSLVAKGLFSPAVYAPVNRHSVAPKASHQLKVQQQQQQLEVPGGASTQPSSSSLPQGLEPSKTAPIPSEKEGAHSMNPTTDGRSTEQQLETPLGPVSTHPETSGNRRASLRDRDGLESGWF